jgi:leucyl-tRNA synthetase
MARHHDRQGSYVLPMFPYPSGTPHMGHVRVYTISDVAARHARLHGQQVLHPMGWDSFGLPTENAALARGLDPADWTAQNIARMKATFQAMGWGFDWEHEIDTSSPGYYRWTQWLFLRLHERGLAVQREDWAWHCARCATVLAEEQVEDGACWRCGERAQRRRVPQWTFRITAHAERLWAQLDRLTGWDPRAVAAQRSWIGRTEGQVVHFQTQGGPIEVFVPHSEVGRGVQAVWLAPEHPLAWVEPSLRAQAEAGARRSPTERAKSPPTVRVQTPFTTREGLPVWLVDSVVPAYGTQAVAVMGGEVHVEGERVVRYHLHDWSVGRQRRWGCPIPMLDCPRCGQVPVPDRELPVRLEDPPERTCPRCGSAARRESDTLDTFVCSAWYTFRFTDPHREDAPFSPEAVARWMPVSTYVGGLDHAARHMLYFRFISQVLHDAGLIPFDEPVSRFVCNGIVRNAEGLRMSKSVSGSGVDPAQLLERFSPDAIRLAILADTPVERDLAWDTARVEHKEAQLERMSAQLEQFVRAWPGAPGDPACWPDEAQRDRIAALLAALDKDLQTLALHNAVARVYELWAALQPVLQGAAVEPGAARALARDVLVAISPLVPGWVAARWPSSSGEPARWPVHARVARPVPVVVQVDGRRVGTMQLPPDATADQVEAAARERFAHRIGPQVARVVRAGSVVNFVRS